ncbi:MAG: ISNCY family transposase [Polyangiales bacterium]|nr:ISNCY family transposase [Sandaracinaceae bacterium]
MSTKELDRTQVVVRVLERRLSQRDAARQLGVSPRTVRRLCRAYEEHGPAGLISRHRGRRSNRRTPEELRRAAATLLTAHYADFGPTLATEKLTELHGFDVSVPTVRKWMIELGLWTPRRKRRAIHQPRRRRPCRGELVQIDGSDHEWFEDRAPRAVLLVFVDDATGELMELRFVEGETTFGYFECVQRYLKRHGRPVAFYSDKASIFRVNRNDHGGSGLTQFGRAMDDLNIDVFCANTAPAKGRVERANRTLQDRLVKELRLQGISDMVTANEFLDAQFREDFNARFARVPESDHDAHRPLLLSAPIEDIFKLQARRKVTKRLTINYQRTLYVLEKSDAARAVMGKEVLVYEDADGAVSIRTESGFELDARAFDRVPRARIQPGTVVEDKLLGRVLEYARAQQQDAEAEREQLSRTKRERRLAASRIAASETK